MTGTDERPAGGQAAAGEGGEGKKKKRRRRRGKGKGAGQQAEGGTPQGGGNGQQAQGQPQQPRGDRPPRDGNRQQGGDRPPRDGNRQPGSEKRPGREGRESRGGRDRDRDRDRGRDRGGRDRDRRDRDKPAAIDPKEAALPQQLRGLKGRQEKPEPAFKHVTRRYGVAFYETFQAAKADMTVLAERERSVDQLNIVIRQDGNMDDPELTGLGKVKVFAGQAWTLIHERRQQDGWYEEPR